MDKERMNAELVEIASMAVSIDTLETRNSDSLDFHEVSVWDLRDALERAYLAGIASTAPTFSTGVIPTSNKEWGYWGTICGSPIGKDNAAAAWGVAFISIQRETGASPEAVRDFLDSPLGRHFADCAVGNYKGDFIESIEAAVRTWMTWSIGKYDAMENGIPMGLPYLQGHVMNLEVNE